MPQVDVGDGIALYYELYDFTPPWKPGPPPVVFLHGLGGDRRLWLFQIPVFSAKYPTVVVDLRGHGLSTPARGDFTTADMARDVIRLTRHLGIERAHFVGLSMGGVVAQQVAFDFPLVVASLVLADTFGSLPEPAREMAKAALQRMEEQSMADIARERITAAFSDAVDPAMREYFIEQVAKNDREAYLRAARATFRFDPGERLSTLRSPTLVVVGKEDRVTPLPLAELLAKAIPGAKLAVIERAGHIASAENPQGFNRAVLDFLATL
ncbi:MAG: alpha/beta fold hydrolase [Candidatus Binatia bacterium]|nr:alpha/beta fold hydrolase [Candidatus Binatia bacterium]